MAVNLTRTNEGGSVVSFAVIAVVLIAIVIGGIYIVQKRGQNTQVAGPTSSHPATPSGAPGTNAPKSSTAIPTPPPPSTKPPGITTTPPPVVSSNGQTIPTTGPSDLLPGGAVFAVLVGVSVAYVGSRRQLRNALSQVD